MGTSLNVGISYPVASPLSMDARSSSVVRVGVVGAGFAATSHIDALRRIPNVHVAGILASAPERTVSAAQRLGVDAVGSLDRTA